MRQRPLQWRETPCSAAASLVDPKTQASFRKARSLTGRSGRRSVSDLTQSAAGHEKTKLYSRTPRAATTREYGRVLHVAQRR